MKICVETQTLASEPTGLYRYTSNLYENYLKLFSTHELCAVSFKDHDNNPYDPELFARLFESSLIGTYKAHRNWLPIAGGTIISPNRSKSEQAYESYRAQVRRGKMNGMGEPELKKIKYKRETTRIRMQLHHAVRSLRFGVIEPVYCDRKTKVIHSPYHAFPNDFQINHPMVMAAQTVHDLIPLKFPEIFSKEALKDFRRIVDSALKCDVIFVPSEATRRDLLSCEGFHLKNIVVTPLAADKIFTPALPHEIESCRRKFSIPEDKNYLLSVSTLEPRKNFPFLLKAFSKLIGQGSDRKPVLVLTGKKGWGDGTQIEIQKLLDDMKDHVIYTGYVTDNELRALYTGALAFLMPSIYEGFGLPLLESMACGTPVISSNTSSMPEVVGEAGILIPPIDEDLWVSSMLTMVNLNKSQYAEMTAKAHGRSSLFSWERTARLTHDAFRYKITK
jgi:glycosyltransferase involved in cell wall biosynthesis